MHKERLQRCGVFSLLISLSTTISRDGWSPHMLSLVHACQEYSSTPGHIGQWLYQHPAALFRKEFAKVTGPIASNCDTLLGA